MRETMRPERPSVTYCISPSYRRRRCLGRRSEPRLGALKERLWARMLETPVTSVRRILHIDMDAFYASVEQRDDPSLKGRPVAVGGDPGGRGVVAAASYEARAFGVRSAIPMSRAVRLCPQLVIVRPAFERYRAVSNTVFEIFRSITRLVEPLSLDEAYLDVTENAWGEPFGMRVAERVKAAIREATGLTASAG